MYKHFFSLLLIISCTTVVNAQSVFEEYQQLFTPPKNYVVGYTSQAPIIDVSINDEVWNKAQWTEPFVDIEGDAKPKPYHDTKVKMLWDDNYLYFAAELKDPHVWAKLTERDQIVFFDNDFEIFISPTNNGHQYFEIEINALNTIFDLFLPKPYREGGAALFAWNTPGMKHAVNIQGSLNNANDEDEGWTVEIAVPHSAWTIGNNVHTPKDGEIWRLNFSRVQWETDIVDGKYIKRKDVNGKDLPENNWVWSPQGVINMHYPERWGYLQFSKKEVGNPLPTFTLPYSEKQRQYLWLVYYKQKDFHSKNNRYASNLKELGLNNLKIAIDGNENKLSLESTKNQFRVVIADNQNKTISLNQEGLISN